MVPLDARVVPGDAIAAATAEGTLEFDEEEADWAPRRPPLSAVRRLSTSCLNTSRSVTWRTRGAGRGKGGGGRRREQGKTEKQDGAGRRK